MTFIYLHYCEQLYHKHNTRIVLDSIQHFGSEFEVENIYRNVGKTFRFHSRRIGNEIKVG
jgi:hypothetical protein